MAAPPTIFLGGSRSLTRLHPVIVDRMRRIMETGFHIVLGDAAGIDRALQQHLAEASYRDVTIFCGDCQPRNYLGPWAIRRVHDPFCARGYQFHAARDRAMSDEAQLGFMIWDGSSPGTALNALRLTGQNKPAFIFDARNGTTVRLQTVDDWTSFIAHYPSRIRAALRSRITAAEQAVLPGHY